MSDRKLVLELEVKANATAARNAIKEVGDEAEKSGRKVKSFASQFRAEVEQMDKAAATKARAAGRELLHGPASKSDGSEGSWGTPVGWGPGSASGPGGTGGGKSLPGGGTGGAGGRGFNAGGLKSLGLGGLSRFAGPAALAYLAGHSADAMAADPNMSLAQGIGSGVEGFAQYVPGGKTVFDALGGPLGLSSTASKKSAADMVTNINERGGLAAQLQGMRNAGDSQIGDLRRDARNAKTDYLSASRFQADYAQVTDKSQFNTEDKLGVSTSQTGGLRLEKMKSEAALTESYNAAGEAKQAVAAQQAKRDAALQAVKEQGAAVQKADEFANAAERARDNKSSAIGITGTSVGYSPAIAEANQKIDQQASEGAANAAQARLELKRREVEVEKQNVELNKTLENSKQRQLDVGTKFLANAQNEVNLAKDQLSIARTKQSAIESNATQSVMEDDATKKARLDVARKLKSGANLASLTDEEKQLFLSDPLAQNGGFAKDKIAEFNRTDTLTQQRQEVYGVGSLDQAKADTGKWADEVNAKTASAATASAKIVGDAFADALTDMTKAIKDYVADAVRSAQGEFTKGKADEHTLGAAQP